MATTLQSTIPYLETERVENVAHVCERSPVSMMQVFTMVVWIVCASVGVMGFLLPYARPVAPPKPIAPVQAEVLHVELTHDPLPEVVRPTPIAALPTPTPLSAANVVDAPPLTPVAEPSMVTFALPVEGPTVVVEAAKATYVAKPNMELTPAPIPQVQRLTYGHGDGRQPAPEYPLRARREGQEGVATIRFTVGEDGRVLTADLAERSPWALLNDAALKVVRQKWRFQPGLLRTYEVAIRFQLTK